MVEQWYYRPSGAIDQHEIDIIATKRIHLVAGAKEQRRPTLACISSFPRCMLNILTSHVVVNALNAPTKEPKIGTFI